MHQTSHFKMEITNAKGEIREVLVINPIPSSFASIGGNNITKEKIDNNPYITVRKGSESGREYYYASFAGYTTLQNLNDSLRRDGLATEGSVFNSDIVLDENIIKENQILMGFPHPSGANVNRLVQLEQNKEEMINFLKKRTVS